MVREPLTMNSLEFRETLNSLNSLRRQLCCLCEPQSQCSNTATWPQHPGSNLGPGASQNWQAIKTPLSKTLQHPHIKHWQGKKIPTPKQPKLPLQLTIQHFEDIALLSFLAQCLVGEVVCVCVMGSQTWKGSVGVSEQETVGNWPSHVK